jgi:hypothetical protein
MVPFECHFLSNVLKKGTHHVQPPFLGVKSEIMPFNAGAQKEYEKEKGTVHVYIICFLECTVN